MKKITLILLLVILTLSCCSCEDKRQVALKKWFYEMLVEESADDAVQYIGEITSESRFAVPYTVHKNWYKQDYIYSANKPYEINEYDALEIGDAVINSHFDEKQTESITNYDVYEIEGENAFIVKRYNEQKSIYVALDKTNCEILGVWED